MLQKRGFAPGSSLPVPMSSDAAAAANPNETVSTFLTWLSQSTGGLSNSTGSTAIPENNNTLSLGPFGNFTIPVPAELARLLNATTTTSQENHFDFPEDFNTKLADWAVQKQNFTGEAPLVVAVQHPLNLSEQAVTLFNVWDEENPVGSQWLDTLTAAVEAEEPADGGEGDELKFPDGEDDKDLLQLVTDLFASMNGTIGTVQDVKNATLVAQRLGGVAATFEEVVEA
ncbi:MAG: hypothetical protein M1831_000896 [Alyxoria varia]|nr:MAG: hypothetical protein M1831_000896 [Alyxoria varia]